MSSKVSECTNIVHKFPHIKVYILFVIYEITANYIELV